MARSKLSTVEPSEDSTRWLALLHQYATYAWKLYCIHRVLVQRDKTFFHPSRSEAYSRFAVPHQTSQNQPVVCCSLLTPIKKKKTTASMATQGQESLLSQEISAHISRSTMSPLAVYLNRERSRTPSVLDNSSVNTPKQDPKQDRWEASSSSLYSPDKRNTNAVVPRPPRRFPTIEDKTEIAAAQLSSASSQQ
jgi:hypothetical protein